MSAITVINSFEVPAGREGEFLELWKEVNTYMQRKPGYLGNKLHRAIAPDAPFQFVHVAQWASMAQFQGAHDRGFRELVDQAVWSAFVSHRTLFEVVHEAQGWRVSSPEPSLRPSTASFEPSHADSLGPRSHIRTSEGEGPSSVR